jgi:hypothetical protein
MLCATPQQLPAAYGGMRRAAGPLLGTDQVGTRDGTPCDVVLRRSGHRVLLSLSGGPG